MPSTPLFTRMPTRLAWQIGAIALGMGTLLLITTLLSIIGLLHLRHTNAAALQAQQRAMLAQHLSTELNAYAAIVLEIAWTHTTRQIELDRLEKRFRDDLDQARQTTTAPEQRALLDSLEQLYKDFSDTAHVIVQRSQQGRDSEATVLWLRAKNTSLRLLDTAREYARLQQVQAEAMQRQAAQRTWWIIALVVAGAVLALALGLGIAALLSRRIAQALRQITAAAQRFAKGHLQPMPIPHSVDELATLAQTFNQMAGELQQQYAAQQRWNEQLEAQVQQRTAELEQALAHQRDLLTTIRRMSTPVLPVLDGVLVMPLIGLLDDERMANAQAALLQALEQERAHTAILDITGVPVVDTAVAQQIVATVQQARLLGASCQVVGITPAVAQALVRLDVDMRQVLTSSDLRSAVRQVLRFQPLKAR